MKLTLSGVTVELPDDVLVDFSEDGKYVKITTKPAEVVERIRVVEIPGPVQERIRVVEKIIEVEKPCPKQHYPPQWPHIGYPWTTTTGGNTITWNGNTIR